MDSATRIDDVARLVDYLGETKHLPPTLSVQYYFNAEGKQLTPLRANWEVEIKWKL